MIRFAEFPLIVQNFLSDWMDELIQVNADHQINKKELSESLVKVFCHFALAIEMVLREIQTDDREDGAPFHLTIGPEGLQFRSNSDHSIFCDDNLFAFKLALVQIPEWEQDVALNLKENYGQLNLCMPFLEVAVRTFLQTLSDQVSLTCIFPVPAPDGAAHENVAAFRYEDDQILIVCESDPRHTVVFQG